MEELEESTITPKEETQIQTQTQTSLEDCIVLLEEVKERYLDRFGFLCKLKERYLDHFGLQRKLKDQPYTKTIDEIEKRILDFDLTTKERLLKAMKLKASVNKEFAGVEITLTSAVISGAALLVAVVGLLVQTSVGLEFGYYGYYLIILVALIASAIVIFSCYKSGKKRGRVAGFYELVLDILKEEIESEQGRK